jgi:ABC-type oligopeptide transport system substrate-binding subunit
LDEAIARQIQINLLSIGVDIKPRPVNRIELNDRLQSNDFEAVLMDWNYEDNVQSLMDFFAEDGARNYTGYQSSTFQKYLGFYRQMDSKGRATVVQSMQKVINADQPVTFLFHKWNEHHIFNTTRVRNVKDIDNKGAIRPFDQWILVEQ